MADEERFSDYPPQLDYPQQSAHSDELFNLSKGLSSDKFYKKPPGLEQELGILFNDYTFSDDEELTGDNVNTAPAKLKSAQAEE
jgi:hypothetical protein